MPGCVMRAFGADFEPEEFLRNSTLEVCNVFRKGSAKAESRKWESSGITVVVSEESDFEHQLVDAIAFLQTNGAEVSRLKSSAGLEGISLDFGVNRTSGFLQSHRFSRPLIQLAAELPMALELSIYA